MLLGGLVLAGCQPGVSMDSIFPKAERPISAELVEVMKEKEMSAASPIMIRIFKEESVAEVWKETRSGRYALLSEFEICKWSGKLGPKFEEGDRQAPEGFYNIKPWQMNPNSDYHLAFNLGFPNTYDRAHERTGSHLMMHGACSSAGCYSMTDPHIEQIFALARESFEGGQTEFQVQAFPFRMTPENMAEHKDNEHFEFWTMLKEGYDHFEITRVPPKIDVCDKRYVFNRIAEEEDAEFKASAACPEMTMPPSLALAYSEKVSKDAEIFQQVLKKQAIREAFTGKNKATTEAVGPVADEAAETAETSETPATIDGEEVEQAQGGIPIPQPAPREVVEEPVKKPGLLSWLFGKKS